MLFLYAGSAVISPPGIASVCVGDNVTLMCNTTVHISSETLVKPAFRPIRHVSDVR